jgi:hypothetical protein
VSNKEATLLLTVSDICGELARWVYLQHPYGDLSLVPEACDALFKAGLKDPAWEKLNWSDSMPKPFMTRKFTSHYEVEGFLQENLPERILKEWNSRREEKPPGASISDEHPEWDFIDIDALTRNVSREVWQHAFVQKYGHRDTKGFVRQTVDKIADNMRTFLEHNNLGAVDESVVDDNSTPTD